MARQRQPVGSGAAYEIRVAGLLDACWAVWFPGLTLRGGAGETIISGVVTDQAALHGVLAQVRDLGLTLLLVRRLSAAPPDRQQRAAP